MPRRFEHRQLVEAGGCGEPAHHPNSGRPGPDRHQLAHSLLPHRDPATALMKPTNVKAAAQNAEQKVRIAVEQVKAAEKKARAAKEKAWRAKLLFKLARRASRKAKKTAKRARANAVRAQITLKELTEQTAPA